jgi:hypothetical protein
MLNLQAYDVTKKWVIITEISKEVENNNIGRLNAYSRQYVPRGLRVLLMVALEDRIQEMVVMHVLDPVCVYTLISVEIKQSIRKNHSIVVDKCLHMM